MTNDLVSIVLSAYNEEKYLSKSIESILEQTYKNIELILINDGSTDGTKEIIEEYAKLDRRVIPVHQKNIGLTKSLNRGLEISKGKYIARQDADDISEPHRIEIQKIFLDENPDISLCFTWRKIINEEDEIITYFYTCPRWRNIKWRIKNQRHSYAHGTIMFRPANIRSVGNYDESKLKGQDYHLFKALVDDNQKLAVISEILYSERNRKNAIGNYNDIRYYTRLQNLYFRAQNRKYIWKNTKVLYKNNMLNFKSLFRFVMTLQPINYKNIFKYF